MIRRLTDIPVYSSAQTTIESGVYNTIRLATKRLKLPIRIPLPRFRYIDIVIDHDSWACVDRNLNDLPIISWTEFNIANRNALHLPVECKLSYYHFQAAQVAQGALEFTKMELERKCASRDAERPQSDIHHEVSKSTISQLRCMLPRSKS